MKMAMLGTVVFVMACGGLLYSYGEATVPAEPAGEQFAGKVLLLYMDNVMQVPSQVLKDVQIHEVNGERFLTGIGADTKRTEDWRTGLRISIRWARITGFIPFTPEEFAKFSRQDSDGDRRL